MRNFKKLLIPAIVLAVLIGVYFIATNLPAPEEDDTEVPQAQRPQILDFDKAELTNILIEKENEVMQFEYVTIQVEQEEKDTEGNVVKKMVDRNVWQAIQPKGMNVYSSAIDTIAWNANSLKAEKLIEENPSNLAVYGLNNPVKLTFTLKDGTKHILHIGTQTPTGGAYYAQSANNPTVYTIGSYETERFLKTKLELLITDLYEKEYVADDFKTIKFFRKDKLVFDTYEKEKTQWFLSYPISTEANYSNIYTIAEALSQITTTKFVEENPTDLGKYGLTVPAYKFEYKIDGKDYKLSLGNIDQDSGNYYATLNDGNLVFLLPNTSFTFLDKPIEEIVNSFVYIVNIKDVNQMTVTLDGKTDISKIRANFEDDEESTYEFNGTLLKQADSADSDYISLFKKYYQGAIGLVVDKILIDVQPELNSPVVTIEYLLHTGEKTVVELVPTPDDVSFYAFKNGEYTGITLRQKQLTDENNNGLRISGLKLTEALKERNK